MKSPAQIVADAIAAILPVGTYIPATNLFVGKEPETLDSCITIYDTGGVEQTPNLADDMVTVQVRAKDKSYTDGYANLQKIRLALEGISPYANGANKVEGIWVTTPVTYIGPDKANRPLFTLNLRLLITPEDKGNRR